MITMSKGSSSPKQFGARTVRTVLRYPGSAEVSSWDFDRDFCRKAEVSFFRTRVRKTTPSDKETEETKWDIFKEEKTCLI